MFRIFGKSRSEALKNHRMGRYLGYVIGEILLVVIGILIALQIDNWNDDREEAATLDSYLNSIARNLQSDIKELEELRERRQENLLTRTRVDTVINKSSPYDVDDVYFFNRSVYFARQTLHFIPDTSGYEALKNSGVLDRLQGKDIERLLSDYYDALGNIQYRESEYSELIKPFGIRFEQSLLKDVEDFAFTLPDALSPERFQELQPYYREVIRGPSVRMLFNAQYASFFILQEYEKALALGHAFVQMVGSGRSNFGPKENNLPSYAGDTREIGKADLVVNGAISFDNYGFYFAGSNHQGQEFNPGSMERTGSALRLSYPGGVPDTELESWAAIWFSVNDSDLGRPFRDFSMYDTLQLELKGDLGGESILVHMKDKDDPDDGSQTNIKLVLTDQWQTYEIDLARFENADVSKLNVVTGFLFLDQFEPVSFSIRNARFIKIGAD